MEETESWEVSEKRYCKTFKGIRKLNGLYQNMSIYFITLVDKEKLIILEKEKNIPEEEVNPLKSRTKVEELNFGGKGFFP